jgi:hypothetical protein
VDQRFVAAVKACYPRKTFAQALAATEEEIEKIWTQFWKGCSLAWV